MAAAGVPLVFNDFLSNVNGNIAGTSYSADFTLSSSVGTFGGINSPLVNHANGTGFASEVGPASGFTGILNIDFAFGLQALGFGTVELGDQQLESISLFGPNGLLATFSAISGSVFDYEGFVATGGDVITRAELDGNFFAIQNIKYAAAARQVPEPLGLALFAVAFAGLGVIRRKKS